MRSKDLREHLGLVQVYTGNGKGKTTAALGLALRAMGNGLKVAMVQFMKSDQHYGEYRISKMLPDLTLLPMGRDCLVYEARPSRRTTTPPRPPWPSPGSCCTPGSTTW